MISCPHHSFLSHAGGEKERQAGSKKGAGTAGHRDRAAGSWGTGPSSGSGTSTFPEPTLISTQSSKRVGPSSPKGRSCLLPAACCGSQAGAHLVPHPCCHSA